MSISELSIRRPVLAWMLMAALIVFGGISFLRMGISNMPDVNFPIVNIALRLDNAAPEIMETNVVDVIEDAVMGIDGLRHVTSSVSQGVANITCEFGTNRDIDIALQEVQSRILQVNNLLPTALFPAVLSKINPEDQPIMWVIVTADANVPLANQMMYARNTLKDQLSTIDGVGGVSLAGYVDPNLRVKIDSHKLYSLELTSLDVWNAIANEQIEQPAGRIEAPEKELNVRVLGETRTPKDFAKIRVQARGAAVNYRPTSLGDIAHIEESVSDVRTISRFNNDNAIGLGIIKQHGTNAVAVGQLVEKKVEQMRKELRTGFHINVRMDSTKFVKESVRELNLTLLYAALLTSVVCYLFLGSWSSTFNVLLAIPTSVVGTFIALNYFGFTLNSFTLLGLSLAIGIIVDDAIMMLENIVRHYEMGKTRRQAALDGSNEITFAAFATTLAIAAIFIPVVFMKGIVGAFFYQYGVTVTVAVFLSLLEALTLTPMRSARFMQSSKENPNWLMKRMDTFIESVTRAYQRSLKTCLNLRWTIIAISVMVFVTSLALIVGLCKELIPAQDQSLFLLNIKTPVGSSLQITDAVFKTAENYLHTQPEVKDTYSTVGDYEQNNVVNAGTMYVILKDQKERHLSQSEFMRKVTDELTRVLPAGTAVFGQDLSLTGFSASRGYPIEFVVEGPDWEVLQKSAVDVTAKLQATGLVEGLNTDFQVGMPEVRITPNRDKASERSVNISNLVEEVEYMIGGQIFNSNTEYPMEDHRYYIRVRSDAGQYLNPKDVESIRIRNNFSELVKLSDIAKVDVVAAPQLISRYNRNRAIPIFANVARGKSQQDALDAVVKIGRETLPTGYRLELTGSGNAFHEAFDGLIFALILGIAVAYMILASQFNSFLHPLTILLALPFSVSGALLALYLTNQSLSLFSMIGLILLMGIVKKNSILLVDFTNQQRDRGLGVTEALLMACPTRLRPILMTSIATVAGAIPEALNFGAGAETRVPMAISIIGGVTLSTFLTLFVVPCAYSLLSRLESKEVAEEPGHVKIHDYQPAQDHSNGPGASAEAFV